jgi:hypothetical protein
MFKLCNSINEKFVHRKKNMVVKFNKVNERGTIAYDFYDEVFNERLNWAEFRNVGNMMLE